MSIKITALYERLSQVDEMQDGNEFTPFFNIMNEWYAKDTSGKISTMFKAKTQEGKNVSPGSFSKSYVSCRKPGTISTEQRGQRRDR